MGFSFSLPATWPERSGHFPVWLSDGANLPPVATNNGISPARRDVMELTRIILAESRNIIAPPAYLAAQFKLAAEGKEVYR